MTFFVRKFGPKYENMGMYITSIYIRGASNDDIELKSSFFVCVLIPDEDDIDVSQPFLDDLVQNVAYNLIYQER